MFEETPLIFIALLIGIPASILVIVFLTVSYALSNPSQTMGIVLGISGFLFIVTMMVLSLLKSVGI